MADFTGNQIRHTYQRLLQLDDFITQNGTGSINLETVHLSGSLFVTGSQVISQNLHVLGNVTAQQFIASTVSSSIVYESGSSQFGNSSDDTHHFTGSVNLTGSYNQTGNNTRVGDTELVGDLNITGNTTQEGNLVQTGSLNLSGSAEITETLEAEKGAFGAFFANPQIINVTTEIPSNYNSRLFGPITVAAGKTLTVGANAKLEIIDI